MQVRIDSSIDSENIVLRSGRDIVITATAGFITNDVVLGFVDDDGPDGGQGGRVLVHPTQAHTFVFTGGADGDLLQGASGSDYLDGGGGVDTLVGREGPDTYVVTAGDVVTETGSSGGDTVISSADWTLGANLEHLNLTSGAAAGSATRSTTASSATTATTSWRAATARTRSTPQPGPTRSWAARATTG